MPTFEYLAENAEGKQINGHAVGASIDQVARDLAARGMTVQKLGLAINSNDPLAARPAPVVETHQPEVARTQERVIETLPEGPSSDPRSYMATSIAGPLVGKVELTNVAFFFRQLATMLEAGVPYVQSLNTLAGQSHSMKMRTIIKEMQGHVEAGRPISAAMQRYPEVFTTVMVSLVKAGEMGGFLDEALSLVADYTDQEIKLRNLYKRVTFYPKVQLAASIVVIIGANIVLASIGSSSRLSSPLTNPITYVWLAPLVFGLFLFFRVGLANDKMKFSWDVIASNIPYIGNTLRQLAMAKFGRAFGALYKGGVPIPQAIHLSAEACGNEWLKTLMQTAPKRLEQGEGISRTLRETGAFSPIVLDMIDTGERTGNLDQMLGKMADFYEDEAATRSTQTAMMSGVLIGLLVAAYILIFILMPFYGGIADTYRKEIT